MAIYLLKHRLTWQLRLSHVFNGHSGVQSRNVQYSFIASALHKTEFFVLRYISSDQAWSRGWADEDRCIEMITQNRRTANLSIKQTFLSSADSNTYCMLILTLESVPVKTLGLKPTRGKTSMLFLYVYSAPVA